MIIKAKIYYTMKSTHPDIKYAKDWTPERVYGYEDTYRINMDYFYGNDDIDDYIKEDLLLVAGGGYDWKHIDNIRFEIIKKGE